MCGQAAAKVYSKLAQTEGQDTKQDAEIDEDEQVRNPGMLQSLAQWNPGLTRDRAEAELNWRWARSTKG